MPAPSLSEMESLIFMFHVPQLRSALRQLGRPSSANKPELRQRLADHAKQFPEETWQVIQSLGRVFVPPQLIGTMGTSPPRLVHPPTITATATTASTMPTVMSKSLELLEMQHHQSLMEHSQVVGSVLLDKLHPRVNVLPLWTPSTVDYQGILQNGLQLVCRFVTQAADHRFDFPKIWPSGCVVRAIVGIGGDNRTVVLVDTTESLSAKPPPPPSLDLTSLLSNLPVLPSLRIEITVKRLAQNVPWRVVLFLNRKQEFATTCKRIFSISPSMEASTQRMLQSFQSDAVGITCTDPVLLKLKDPVSMQLIVFPVRTQECRHLQCFDFQTHVEMNCKARQPKWTCALCRKPARIENLVVDFWFYKLLRERSDNCFRVLIQPNGGHVFQPEEEDDSSSEDDELPAAKRQQPQQEQEQQQPQQQPVAPLPVPTTMTVTRPIPTLHPPPPIQFPPNPAIYKLPLPPLPSIIPPITRAPSGSSKEDAILLLDDDDELF